MLTKKEIANALGLSCVENYFLPWLEKSYDITNLYGNSFVGLGQVFDDFLSGATYENYCYLPRMQDLAEDYGIVTHEYCACSVADALNKIKSVNEKDLCLIRVNTAFFTNFKRASWREDHYVCIGSDMKWINEYPLSVGEFGEEEFARVYDGALCIYKTADLSAVPPETATTGFISRNFDAPELPRGADKTESALGILRVTRKRLEKFFAEKKEVQTLLHEENVLLDRLYFKLHMGRIKEELAGVMNF